MSKSSRLYLTVFHAAVVKNTSPTAVFSLLMPELQNIIRKNEKILLMGSTTCVSFGFSLCCYFTVSLFFSFFPPIFQ